MIAWFKQQSFPVQVLAICFVLEVVRLAYQSEIATAFRYGYDGCRSIGERNIETEISRGIRVTGRFWLCEEGDKIRLVSRR